MPLNKKTAVPPSAQLVRLAATDIIPLINTNLMIFMNQVVNYCYHPIPLHRALVPALVGVERGEGQEAAL
jgi:hypothetical protein